LDPIRENIGRSRGTNKGRLLDEFIRCRITYNILIIFKIISFHIISTGSKFMKTLGLIYSGLDHSLKVNNVIKSKRYTVSAINTFDFQHYIPLYHFIYLRVSLMGCRKDLPEKKRPLL